MKKLRFNAIIVILIALVVGLTGCVTEGIQMKQSFSSEQQLIYDEFILGMATNSRIIDLPESTVKNTIALCNLEFRALC